MENYEQNIFRFRVKTSTKSMGVNENKQLIKEKNQLDATYFIIYSILIQCSTCFGR